MAQWTSKYTILRDLSVAQGRVPVAIEAPVGAGDKPPSLNIAEETEEEFFKHCSAEANVSIAPDLDLIKKMLDMVRDVNYLSDEDDTDKAVIISKLNPTVPEFIPKQENASTPTGHSPTKQIKEKPKKRQRNIALESILQGIADSKKTNEIILRKPNDFITVDTETELSDTFKDLQVLVETAKDVDNDSSISTAVEKVKGWLDTQTESPFPKKANKVTLEAANIVYKKKEKPKKIEKSLREKLVTLEKSSVSSSSNSGEYKPSGLAGEYYKEYLERNKFKESVKEDIWTKAEKKMREIEEKRMSEAVQSLTSPSGESASSSHNQSFEEIQKMEAFSGRLGRCLDLVALPQHRHRLTGDCIVCEVMTKKPQNEENITTNEENIAINEENDI